MVIVGYLLGGWLLGLGFITLGILFWAMTRRR